MPFSRREKSSRLGNTTGGRSHLFSSKTHIIYRKIRELEGGTRNDLPSGREIVTAPSVPVDIVGPLDSVQYDLNLEISGMARVINPVMALDAQFQ